MAFLIDSANLIQAKNLYYPFEICPAFWECLEQEHVSGRVRSVEAVFKELIGGDDDLARWAKACDKTFFPPIDAATGAALRQVVAHVQGLPLLQTTKSEFQRGADPILIACALAHGHTVVTHEVLVASNSKQIKIPNVCEQFKVPYCNTFEMLLQLGARFVLEQKSAPHKP